MMSVDTAHARSEQPLPDGHYLAVTLLNRGPYGIMVWSGRLHPLAADSTADEISPGDYVQRESVSFMSWHDAIDYFRDRDVAPLLADLVGRSRRNELPSQA